MGNWKWCPAHFCVCSVYRSAARFVLEEHPPRGRRSRKGVVLWQNEAPKRFITYHPLLSLTVSCVTLLIQLSKYTASPGGEKKTTLTFCMLNNRVFWMMHKHFSGSARAVFQLVRVQLMNHETHSVKRSKNLDPAKCSWKPVRPPTTANTVGGSPLSFWEIYLQWRTFWWISVFIWGKFMLPFITSN